MISAIIPVYNEQDSVQPLHQELVAVLTKTGTPFEILFVDDGSTDATVERVRALAPVRLVALSRNFGKSQALMAGFAEARGDVIFTLDGDLQDNPAEIPAFLRKLREGYDLVVGWKQRRQDGSAKNTVSKIANAVTGFCTGVRVHDMNCGFKLYRAEAAKSLDLHGDMHRYIPALLAMRGFRIGEVPVAHRERRFGVSKYGNFRRLSKSFFDFVTLILMRRFLDRPMHFFGTMGLIAGFVGTAILAHLAYVKVVFGETIGDRPLLLFGVLLAVVGLQLFSSGFLGELLIRQGSRRIYTVRERLEQ